MVVHCGKSEAATLGRVLWRFAIRFGRIKGPLVREDKAVVLEGIALRQPQPPGKTRREMSAWAHFKVRSSIQSPYDVELVWSECDISCWSMSVWRPQEESAGAC